MATKREFVENAYYYNSMNASVQHNRLYGPQDSSRIKDEIRLGFRRQLADFVDPFLTRSMNVPKVMECYKNGGWALDEAAFLSAVHRLRDVMHTVLRHHSSGGQFRVSHAQKSFALLLKYYWCAGEMAAAPPFCPLDRRVLSSAGIRENWTQLDDMSEYMRWLRNLGEVANSRGYRSLAEWELATYW